MPQHLTEGLTIWKMLKIFKIPVPGQVSRIMGVCHSLRDEVNSYRDRQQQKVLYVLTLVTTLVMPTHLLTGIFGMNWQDEAGYWAVNRFWQLGQNGDPVVPGLGKMEEQRGYYLFWGLALFHLLGDSSGVSGTFSRC